MPPSRPDQARSHYPVDCRRYSLVLDLSSNLSKDTVEMKMRASAVEKLKLESKVCHEDTIKYKTSPLKKPKIELDAKLDDSIIDEEEISQDELVGMLEEKT